MVRVAVEQRRPQLIRAATAVIAREGVAAATTRAIAAEAGVALGVVHYCYASKDELMADVITSLHNWLALAAEGAVSGEAGLRDGLLNIADAMFVVLEGDPVAQLALYELTVLALRSNGLRHLAVAQYEQFMTLVGRIVDAQLAACSLRLSQPPAAVARLVAVFTDGLILAWLVDRDTAASRGAVAVLADLMALAAVPA